MVLVDDVMLLGSARILRAASGILPDDIRTSKRFRQDAEINTQDACAPQQSINRGRELSDASSNQS